MKLSELQSKLSLAYQMDLEHGVAWINEQESVKFQKNYPDMAEMIAESCLYERIASRWQLPLGNEK